IPGSGCVHGGMYAVKKRFLESSFGKESTAGPRIADTNLVFENAEAPPRDLAIATDDHDRAGAHVLLFAGDAGDSLIAVIAEGLRWMFEQFRMLARFRRRHRRWEVDQPLRIGGKAAHHLESSNRVLFANRDVAVQTCRDEALPQHVVDVEQVIELLLRRK